MAETLDVPPTNSQPGASLLAWLGIKSLLGCGTDTNESKWTKAER